MSPFFTSFRKVLTKGEVSSPSPHSPSLRMLLKGLSLFFLLPSLCFADDWTREDSYRQSALTALLIADWAQTRWVVKHPIEQTGANNFRLHEEGNPLLGKHPSLGQVNNYFAASVAGHAAIGYMLPRNWREAWSYVWIGIETRAVASNYKVGVKFNF